MDTASHWPAIARFCLKRYDLALSEPNLTVSSPGNASRAQTTGGEFPRRLMSRRNARPALNLHRRLHRRRRDRQRARTPQALKIALPIAGATTVTAGSPTPVGLSPLAMTLTATSGT
jgi:hypothetical protein